MVTPLKTNMSFENQWLGYVFPTPISPFLGDMLMFIFLGCIHPPKFNMEPEKKSLEKEVPLGNHHFQVPC